MRIGSLSWRVREGRSGRVVATGARDYAREDLVVKPMGAYGRRLFGLSLPLTDPFALELVQVAGPKAGPPRGFGFSAYRGKERVFCWEWFVLRGGVADKLQERGRLAVEIADDEIARTEFLTDVSVRLLPLSLAAATFFAKPQWRIDILEGSWVRWPTSPHLEPWPRGDAS